MSQRELAEAVGFGSHQIVSELERGQRDVKAWELARIADALHTSLPKLLKLEDASQAEARVFWRSHGPDADRCQHEARLLERPERYRRVEELTGARCDTQPLPRFSVKLANVFASALLLPSDDLRAEFRSRFEGREASHLEVVNMARAYGVSTEALLWRLRSLDLMSEDAVPKRLDDPSFRRMDRASMPKHWTRPPPDLPDRFVRLVALAYRTGDLSRSVAAKYLETNPGELCYLDWDDDDGGADETGVA